MIAMALGEWNNSIYPERYRVDRTLAVLWGSLYDFSWGGKSEWWLHEPSLLAWTPSWNFLNCTWLVRAALGGGGFLRSCRDNHGTDTPTPGFLLNPFSRVREDWGWSSPLHWGHLQRSPSSKAFPVAGPKPVFLRSHLLEVLLGRVFTP